MKKQLLILLVAGGIIANILYAPVERSEIFDRKAQEKTQKTPEDVRKDEVRRREETARRLAEEALRARTAWIGARGITQDQIIKKIQTTYKADDVNDPRKVETHLQDLEELRKQSVDKPSITNVLDTKILESINRVARNIQSVQGYAGKLDSAALEAVLRNIKSINQYQDELGIVIKNVSPKALLKASEKQSVFMKEAITRGLFARNDINKFNGEDISSLLKARIELADLRKKQDQVTDVDLVDDYTKILSKASPEALRQALSTGSTITDLSKILKNITTSVAIPEFSKSQQIKDLFDTLLRINNPDAKLIEIQAYLLSNIKDFSVFKTMQDRAGVLKTLTEWAKQVLKINEPKQLAAAHELMVNLVDRFLELNDKTPQEINAIAGILKAIPSESAANSERALILSLISLKGFDTTIITVLNNHMSRKELTLDLRLAFLKSALNEAKKQNLPLKENITSILIQNFSKIEAKSDIPQDLFEGLDEEEISLMLEGINKISNLTPDVHLALINAFTEKNIAQLSEGQLKTLVNKAINLKRGDQFVEKLVSIGLVQQDLQGFMKKLPPLTRLTVTDVLLEQLSSKTISQKQAEAILSVALNYNNNLELIFNKLLSLNLDPKNLVKAIRQKIGQRPMFDVVKFLDTYLQENNANRLTKNQIESLAIIAAGSRAEQNHFVSRLAELTWSSPQLLSKIPEQIQEAVFAKVFRDHLTVRVDKATVSTLTNLVRNASDKVKKQYSDEVKKFIADNVASLEPKQINAFIMSDRSVLYEPIMSMLVDAAFKNGWDFEALQKKFGTDPGMFIELLDRIQLRSHSILGDRIKVLEGIESLIQTTLLQTSDIERLTQLQLDLLDDYSIKDYENMDKQTAKTLEVVAKQMKVRRDNGNQCDQVMGILEKVIEAAKARFDELSSYFAFFWKLFGAYNYKRIFNKNTVQRPLKLVKQAGQINVLAQQRTGKTVIDTYGLNLMRSTFEEIAAGEQHGDL